ncbi:hypothetical protein AMJ57_03675 [Parcubacteria bacterium SG8_24]|nr:MAG: hypothetical protein AMJ57_03675 [Parcubacteria bacterium SG8_24]
MHLATLAIPFAFVLLAALLCWFVVTAKGRWWVKLTLVILVPSFCFVIWGALSSYLGWPTDERPVGKTLLLWVSVQEPQPQGAEPGAIFLWLVPLEEEEGEESGPLSYARLGGEPRAHRLPYDRQSHEMLSRAADSLRQGRPVVLEWIEREPTEGGGGSGSPETEEGEEGRPEGTPREGNRYGHQDQEFRMYELPAPVFPEKDR